MFGETDVEEAAHWDPTEHTPIEISVGTVASHGFNIPNINYGGLGSFAKFNHNNESEVKRSLHWLDVLGAQSSPN